MSGWLDADWGAQVADALQAWPAAGAETAPVQVSFTVLGGPDGDVTGSCLLWGSGGGAGREVSLTLPAAETRDLVAGRLAPSVAFMRGRMKTSGDPGALLEVLEATTSSAWDELRARVDAATDPM